MLRVLTGAALEESLLAVPGWKSEDLAGGSADPAEGGAATEASGSSGQDGGAWTAADGATAAWFRDPGGNRPSLSRFAK
jgi:hypothetical protein